MSPHNRPLSRRKSAAFSLIEIVLAVGIISFALVAILGLFPVAIQNATDSQRETQAALIARSIFSDLETQRGQHRFVFLGKVESGDSSTGSGKESDRKKASIDLLTGTPVYLGYDSEGVPINDGKISAGEYNSGTSKAAYAVEVRSNLAPPAPTPPPGVTQVEVTVGVPAQASKDNRRSTSYSFITLLDNGGPASSSSP